MVNTFLIDLFRTYKQYRALSIALVGELASFEQCEIAACIFKVYSYNAQQVKFFPTDADATVGSVDELNSANASRRAVDMPAALTQARQFFDAQQHYAKSVLFVLSTSLHFPHEITEQLKARKVDILVLSRTQNPIQQSYFTRSLSGQYLYVDEQKFLYLKQFASQETARIEQVSELTTPTTLALRVTGCESAREFRVQVSEERSVIWHTLGTTGRTFKVECLTPGSTYLVRVKSTTDEWLREYSELFRFTLPAAVDVSSLMRRPKFESELVAEYKKHEKELANLPGKRITLLVQGNKRDTLIRMLQNTLPKSKKKQPFKICFAATQSDTVGTYYPVLAIDPSCDLDALVSQFNAIERVPWPLYVVLLVDSRTVHAISEDFINRLCAKLRITRSEIIVVREDDPSHNTLPFELVVNIMDTLTDENPELFDVLTERVVSWNSEIVSPWELFDRYYQGGEALPPSIVVLFCNIQWHPRF